MRLTPAERWLARAAILEGAEGREAWARWRATGGDLDATDAATFAVLPLLVRNLEANGVEGPDLPRLRGVYRHAWVANQRLLAHVAPAIEQLEGEGIRTLLLGGAALNAHFGDAGARRLDGVEVLVAAEHLGRALEVADSGDLRPRARGGGDQAAWDHAVPATLGPLRTRVAAPTEQLLTACVSTAHDPARRLAHVVDVGLLLGGADRIDWPRLVRSAVRRDLALSVHRALTLTRADHETPVPEPVLAELAAHPSVRERLRLALGRLRR